MTRAPSVSVASAVPTPAREVPKASEGPIRIELLNRDEKPEMFVMRGEPRGPGRLVFLHGMCGHGQGYAQSFQFSAAKFGTLIAPQADVVCGKGPWAKWSPDLETLDQRIVQTFKALGHQEPIDDVLVMGYSQGATRAEALARKWPERYSRVILIGAPQAASPRGLQHLRAAVMMAGEFDRKDLMNTGMRAFQAAEIRVAFMILPKARHAAMGETPERTMGAALEWIYQSSPELDAGTSTPQ